MTPNLFVRWCLAATALVGLAPLAALAQDAGAHNPADLAKAFPKKAPYSPYAGRNFPTRPLFGDTHLHTAFSMDAGAFGARLAPRDAYRFARGEEVTSHQRPAGEAVAPARLPGRRRSLRRHGLLPAARSAAIPSSWPTRRAASGTT